MKHATPSTGSGPLTGVFGGLQPFATQQVPDHCEPGYEMVEGVWQKGAARLAAETADGNDATKRTQLKNAATTFQAGNATGAQVQDAIAFLLRKLL
jgi:capsular polysaccharide biosynthesis protein